MSHKQDQKNRASELEAALGFAADKAARDKFFMSSALNSFVQGEKKNKAELAEYLEIGVEQLSRLALCRRPYSNEVATFRRDTTAIANRFEIKPATLANLLRRAETYEFNQNSVPSGYLMAARDYEDAPEGEQEGKEKEPPNDA